jgi:GTPase SAR1 family protein
MNITRGAMKTAKKVGIYGPEGVGKTSFAARFPGAVFIDTEGSTRHMDVARFDPPEELSDVITQINYVISNPKQFGTLVIDTVDWLEKLLFNAVCVENKWKSIEDPGYGKGYVAAKQKMQQLLEMLDNVIKVGVHVVLVCHSFIRKFEQPDEMSSYDRYMLKLNEKNIAPLIKEWVDMLLFVNYKTDVVTVEGSKAKKGKGGQKRVMYTNHTATWDAKNRFGLPDEMPFEYELIAELFGEAEPVAEAHEEAPKPEPAPAKTEAQATVQTAAKIPAKKADKMAMKMERPESMKSEDTDKDEVLQTLWVLMDKASIIDPMLIQAVVAEKEYYDADVPIRDYDKEFIEDVLIEAWDQVNALVQDKINELPF